MDLERFRELLHREELLHIDELALHHFGEPFLQANFAKYVQVATDLGIQTVVSSNMNTLPESLARDVLAAGLSRLIISVDAADPVTYGRLRVRGHLERVEENIRTMLTVKSELKSEVFIQVQFIQTPENSSEIGEFEERWTSTPGIDQVVIRRERTHAGQVVRHDKYDKRFEDRQPCRYLWESLVVVQDGTVVPCCKDFDAKMPLGNAFADSLNDIWNGEGARKMRAQHIEGSYESLPVCATCTEWRGSPEFAPDEAQRRVQEFADMKESFRREQRHLRVWE